MTVRGIVNLSAAASDSVDENQSELLVTKVSGGILLFLGLLLLSGYFSLLASWFQGLTPDFLRDRI
jgi:hypothetical protein